LENLTGTVTQQTVVNTFSVLDQRLSKGLVLRVFIGIVDWMFVISKMLLTVHLVGKKKHSEYRKCYCSKNCKFWEPWSFHLRFW